MAFPPANAAPAQKRAVVFIDGQNLYRGARETFGVTHPNYDVMHSARAACAQCACMLSEVRFYTGFLAAADDPLWNRFWIPQVTAGTRRAPVRQGVLDGAIRPKLCPDSSVDSERTAGVLVHDGVRGGRRIRARSEFLEHHRSGRELASG
jgi:hypothetical protein